MKLFSEIHSRYFYIINEILKVATHHPLTSADITILVAELGFAETTLALTPSLLNSNQEGYCLLTNSPAGYAPITKNPPLLTLTTLQKRWLKTIIMDKRFALFSTEPALYYSLLTDIEPLYNTNDILSIDMANDGDAYESPEYQQRFVLILQAIQQGKVLRIAYESGKGNSISADFAPYKLEFSMKDDKFRLVAIRMRDKRLRSLYKLNLSRILSVTVMEWNTPDGLGQYLESLRMPHPVEIQITNERNGFERIFTQLSNFERISEYAETNKTCLMKIYYYEVDEMELLITLLSFGPVIRVLGHSDFKQKFVERIIKQQQLTTPSTSCEI